MSDWIDVCAEDEIEVEDVIRFDHDGRTFAVYRDEDGAVFCTDGLCTMNRLHLADGLVKWRTPSNCPRHNGALQLQDRRGAAHPPPASRWPPTPPACRRAGSKCRSEMEVSLAGKVILVTGAARGVGAAIAWAGGAKRRRGAEC